MRLILIVMLLCVVTLGALFGALNGARVAIDFHFFQVDAPVGGALLSALVLGWLLGGLVAWLGHVPRLRRQARSIRALHERIAADAARRSEGA